MKPIAEHVSALIKRHPAPLFFGVAFALGTMPLALVQFGVLPVGFSQLGALSASLAGVVLAGLEGGRLGVRELLRRGLVWRVGYKLWVIAIFYTGAIAVTTICASALIDGRSVDWRAFDPIWNIVPMMLLLIVMAGLGEEFGWRGFLIPRLQRTHSALISSLYIGLLHSLWHLPLFFVDGTVQNEWASEVGTAQAFLGYSVFVIAWAVQLSWFFNNTRGSVLIAAVVHGAGNAWIGGYLDVTGNFGILGNLVLASLMAAVALACVVVTGPSHLSRVHVRDVLQAIEKSG